MRVNFKTEFQLVYDKNHHTNAYENISINTGLLTKIHTSLKKTMPLALAALHCVDQ